MTVRQSAVTYQPQPVGQVQMNRPKLRDIGFATDYQKMDAETVGYQLWRLWTAKAGFTVRGPRPARLLPGEFFSSLGAGNTFGRFAQKAYPQILGEELNLASLNLGFMDVAPAFYTAEQNSSLIDLINRSKFVTICAFPLENSKGNHEGKPKERASAELKAKIRSRYVKDFSELLALIRVPKVLLCFSEQSGDESSRNGSSELFSTCSVNRSVMDDLTPLCDAYLEQAVESRSAKDGRYVSNKTHQVTAERLAVLCNSVA